MKAVQRVRAANVILGRREDGQHSRLWLAISQSPAKRKRAQLAAKTKRLILELGGAASRLEVEYSTGTAWYNGGRVCSGTAPKQGEDAVEAGAGWIDLPKIARNLGMSEEHVRHAWAYEGAICRLCRQGRGKCVPGIRKTHVRTDPRCRLHGETDRQPSGKARHRVGITTENLVKLRCRGIQPHNGGAWRTLIDEFTDKHFTWITRPLLQTTDAEGGHTFYDTHLQRKYTKAEAEQVQRELGEAEAQKQIRQKARQLLRYYRINDRHPQKLIMNLAYDEHSVDALLEEARDRWGNTPEVGGSEEEDEEPTDVLQFWHEWGDCPLKSPHLDWDDDDDNWDSATRGGLVPVPSGDWERTNPDNSHPTTSTSSRSVPCQEEREEPTNPTLGEQAPVTPPWPTESPRSRSPLPRRGGGGRPPLPRNRPPLRGTNQDRPPPRGTGAEMSSDPRVYGGRAKERWKVESKLRYRAQRKQKRRAKAAAAPPSDRWGRR